MRAAVLCRFDGKAFLSAVHELTAFIEAFEGPVEDFERLVSVAKEAVQVPARCRIVESNKDAAGTLHFSMALEPSERLLVLLAALRAGEVERAVFEFENHRDAPIAGCVATSAIEQTGSGVNPGPVSITE